MVLYFLKSFPLFKHKLRTLDLPETAVQWSEGYFGNGYFGKGYFGKGYFGNGYFGKGYFGEMQLL